MREFQIPDITLFASDPERCFNGASFAAHGLPCGRPEARRYGRIRFPTRAESAKQAGLFLTVEAVDYQPYFRPRQKVRRGRYG
jgi:hypothetical protein